MNLSAKNEASLKTDTVKKLWREISKYTSKEDFSLELEIHKKLLNIFHIGNFYYYIFNCLEAKIEYVSDSVSEILGYPKSFFSIDNLPELIHPDDFVYFVDFERKVTEFFTQLPPEEVSSYKASYDYRIQKADGQYIRILHQATAIQVGENGSVIRVLGVHTDISQWKKENYSNLSFIGLNGRPNFENVVTGIMLSPVNTFKLSERERQILQHLIKGQTSAQIASLLFISKATVDRHRKNMIKKTNSKSTAELTIRSIQENWS